MLKFSKTGDSGNAPIENILLIFVVSRYSIIMSIRKITVKMTVIITAKVVSVRKDLNSYISFNK